MANVRKTPTGRSSRGVSEPDLKIKRTPLLTTGAGVVKGRPRGAKPSSARVKPPAKPAKPPTAKPPTAKPPTARVKPPAKPEKQRVLAKAGLLAQLEALKRETSARERASAEKDGEMARLTRQVAALQAELSATSRAGGAHGDNGDKQVRSPRQTHGKLVALHVPSRVGSSEMVTAGTFLKEIIDRFGVKKRVAFDFEGVPYEQDVEVLELSNNQIRSFFIEKTQAFLGDRSIETLTPGERRQLRDYESVLLNALIKCDSEFQSRERFIQAFFTMCYCTFQRMPDFAEKKENVSYMLDEITSTLRKRRLSDIERIALETVPVDGQEKSVLKAAVNALSPLIKRFVERRIQIALLREMFEERRWVLFKTKKTLTERLTSEEQDKALSPMRRRLIGAVLGVVLAGVFVLLGTTILQIARSAKLEVPKDVRGAYLTCFVEPLRGKSPAVESAIQQATANTTLSSIRSKIMRAFNLGTLSIAFQFFDFVKKNVNNDVNTSPPRWTHFKSADGKAWKLACPNSPADTLATRDAVCRDYAELLAAMAKAAGAGIRFKIFDPAKDGDVGHVQVQVAFAFDGSLKDAKKAIKKMLKDRYSQNIEPNAVEEGETSGTFWVTLDPGQQYPATYEPDLSLNFTFNLTPALAEISEGK